eukprot:c3073_g1_i1.p1 GENE.c3073_g1_i1~~c3073_g1_i1.p1  ORF type:complete len:384 (-),score=60.98 c3073_g1_i1:124-1275(-)
MQSSLHDQDSKAEITPQEAWQSINQLQQSFLHFSKVTDERMCRMESNIARILENIYSNQQHTLMWTDLLSDHLQAEVKAALRPSMQFSSPLPMIPALSSSSPEPVASNPSNTSIPQIDCAQPLPKLKLQILGLTTKWFTRCPLPSFQVRLIDEATGKCFTNTEGYTLCVRLMSGIGQAADELLMSSEALQFPVMSGEVDVAGVRFLAVSSRNGGHFNLKFVITPNIMEPVLSEPIAIRSERLKNENKAQSMNELTPDDPIARVPGIGKKYATKFAEQGLHTVRDLANVDTSPCGRSRRLDILNAVRRDRGALTEAKLVELLREARSVVKREDERQQHLALDADTPCAKRVKLDSSFEIYEDNESYFNVDTMLSPSAFESTDHF